jgi:hypothetical protein
MFSNIEWIRFHEFQDKTFETSKSDKIMRIAILNIAPDIKSRDIFFNDRIEITKQTGWYPLVMGSRISFRLPKIKRLNDKTILSIGEIKNFKVISNSDTDGISFELVGKKGKYLFDFGYKGVTTNDYLAYFLSHTHSDHSGGLIGTIKNTSNNTPIVSSKIVASYVATILSKNHQTKNYKNIYHIDYKTEIILEDGLQIVFVNIFHSPGSIGFIIKDSKTSFFYFGDLCLKNGYSDYFVEICSIVDKYKSSKNIFLLDGAMVGRKMFISEDDKPENILKDFSNNSVKRNIVFFSNQPENSIYAFLSIYCYTQKNKLTTIKLLVSESLIKAMSLIIEPVILDDENFKDPVFETLFGKHKSNPIESQRMYPLNSEILYSLQQDEKVIIFAGINDLKRIVGLTNKFEKSDIILAGTFALREDLPKELVQTKPRIIIRVASEDWSFHSSEDSLKNLIDTLTGKNIKVHIFHNYFQRVLRFIQENNWDNRLVRALGDRQTVQNI